MPTGPTFQLALPTTIRAGQTIQVTGRVSFPGRMLVFARAADGSVLARQAIQVARAGPFRAMLRIAAAARPGALTVTPGSRRGP